MTRPHDTIYNGLDTIDSRDIINRIEYLQDMERKDEDESDELTALEALQAETEGYADWYHGVTLIRESYFEDYAQEMAEDLHGRALRSASWPFTCIDWAQAAAELQQDYTSVDFAGVAYYVR